SERLLRLPSPSPFFFSTLSAPTELYPLSLHDALPILDVIHYLEPVAQETLLSRVRAALAPGGLLLLRICDTDAGLRSVLTRQQRSEEHTSELQSLTNLVCRLLLEKKKQQLSLQARTPS